MSVAIMGFNITHMPAVNIDRIKFSSNSSIFDFDILLLDLNEIANEYEKERNLPIWMGNYNLTTNSYNKFIGDIKRRKKDFYEFVELGRLLIVTLPTSQTFITTGKSSFNVFEMLPIGDDLETEAHEGEKIDFLDEALFNDFFKSTKKMYRYQACFSDNSIGKPLAKIAETNKVVSSYLITESGGTVLFLPALNNSHNSKISSGNEFIDAVYALFKKIKEPDIQQKLPEWTDSYRMVEEVDVIKQMSTIDKKIEELVKEREILDSNLLKIVSQKQLLAGTGRSLEIETKTAFEEIGFSVSEGERGRDDLILKYNDFTFVVEVKGVTKSGTEKHAQQLEKWVMEYSILNDVTPKGILLVVPYKDIPLGERKDASFPNQMVGFSTKRNHCLMTGPQLLCILKKVKKGELIIEELVEELHSCNGILIGHDDLDRFIISD